MGGVSGGMGGDPNVVSFTSQVFQPPGARLDVVTIWRGHQKALRPQGTAGSQWRAPAGWSGSAGGDGQREVLYHEGQRRVRVAGSEFPVPEGRTLVVLIDDRAGESMRRVATRTIAAPVCHCELPDLTLPKPELLERLHAKRLAEQEAWDEALRGDEPVQRFLADGTWPDEQPFGDAP